MLDFLRIGFENLVSKQLIIILYYVISFSGSVFGTTDFKQVTVIARTNLGLFEEMARVLRSQGGDKKKLGFVGVSK